MIDMGGTHDDDELSFITLSAATQNAIRYLRLDKKQNERGNEKCRGSPEDQKSSLEQFEYVRRRLRELAEWERRIREDRLRYKKRK